MISGYVGYDRKTGQIHLRFGPNDLANFERNGSFLIHPVSFGGHYSIELKGKDYTGTPLLLVCLHEDEGYQVSFGFREKNRMMDFWQSASLFRITSMGNEQLDKVEKPPLRKGKPFRFKVTVDSRRITVTANGRRLLSAKKTTDIWGQFGVANLGTFTELQVKGKANSSWIEGLVDAKTRDAEQAFFRTYDIDKDLPDWLRGNGAPTRASNNVGTEEVLPWRLLPTQTEAFEKVSKTLGKGEFQETLRIIDSLPGHELPSDMREYMLVAAYAGLGLWPQALEHCHGLCQRNESFVQGRVVHADLLSLAGHRKKSMEEYRAVIELAPSRSEAYRRLAELQMLDGDLDAAKTTVLAASRASAGNESVNEINAMIVKATRGPNWSRVFEHETEHYEIRSNLDKKTCVESGKVLEEAYQRYEKEFGPLAPFENEKKSPVFLFAGEAGFQKYITGLFGNPSHSTAGLYSFSLKQLLIWNLPGRGDMMETVRHEAAHQYLDALGADPPTWFNEGLAQVLSYLKRDNPRQKFRLGEVDGSHARFLKKYVDQLVPLEQFLYLEGDVFYRNMQFLYPQSWAFVHFLKYGDEGSRRIYDKLISCVLKGMGKKEAVEKAVDGVNLDELEAEFKAHIAAMDS